MEASSSAEEPLFGTLLCYVAPVTPLHLHAMFMLIQDNRENYKGIHMRYPRPGRNMHQEALGGIPRFTSPPECMMVPPSLSFNDGIKNFDTKASFMQPVPFHQIHPDSAASMPILMSFDPTSGMPIYVRPWQMPHFRPPMPFHPQKSPMVATPTCLPAFRASDRFPSPTPAFQPYNSLVRMQWQPPTMEAPIVEQEKLDDETAEGTYSGHAHLKHHYVNTEDLSPVFLRQRRSPGPSPATSMDIDAAVAALAPHQERTIELNSEQDSSQLAVPDSSTGPPMIHTPELVKKRGSSTTTTTVQEADYETADQVINPFKKNLKDALLFPRKDMTNERSAGEQVLSLDRLDHLEKESTVDDILNQLLLKGDKPRSGRTTCSIYA
ncbi:hypothetical protein Ciccas_007152 [Cichlidogyrus casuarinus]|uniref:Uncharacterized protein n=1 Tax=Cichlidogyrus casuarinus TaxID=1844966 RepID=A0ABD2Q3P3_9PLAT